MSLAIHQNTSAAAGYRASLEGWARAGIRNVEITAALLDGFLKTETLAAAKRVLTDNGLTPVSAACGVGGLWEPNSNHAASLDNLKRRCEQFTELGLTHIYAPVGGMAKFVEDDYKTGADQMRKVGDVVKQFNMRMSAEFTRGSSFISTLTTMLRVTRAAAHPNVKPLVDCYHFWSGNNKLEDLDLLKPGEVGHAHFQDVPDMPRELLDNTTRLIPGRRRQSADRRSSGSSPTKAARHRSAVGRVVSVPKYQQGDPYEVARDIRQKAEARHAARRACSERAILATFHPCPRHRRLLIRRIHRPNRRPITQPPVPGRTPVRGTDADGDRRVQTRLDSRGTPGDGQPCGVDRRFLGHRHRDLSTHFNAETLRSYDVVMFALTSGELPFSAAQKSALLDFVSSGHGFIGIHSATDTLYDGPTTAVSSARISRSIPGRSRARRRRERVASGERWCYGDRFSLSRSSTRSRKIRAARVAGPAASRPRVGWVDRRLSARVGALVRRRSRVLQRARHFPETWRDARFERLLASAIGWTSGK